MSRSRQVLWHEQRARHVGDCYNGTTFTGAAYAFAGGVNFASPNDSVFGQASDLLGPSIAPIGALGSPMAVAVARPFLRHRRNFGESQRDDRYRPVVASPIMIRNAAATGTGDMFGSVFSSYVAGVPTATANTQGSFPSAMSIQTSPFPAWPKVS